MIGCKVNIIEAFDLDWYPGWCKAVLKDCNGIEHILMDKLPVIGVEEEELSNLPMEKYIAFKILNDLGINGLEIKDLFLLNGAYVNLEYPLYNRTTVRFLNDNDVYLGNQIERVNSERCYGVVANEYFILVSEYGCNGAAPKIILYKCR